MQRTTLSSSEIAEIMITGTWRSTSSAFKCSSTS
jgi:hypothetical protein